MISFASVAVLCDEQLQEGIRPVTEALELKVVSPDGMLVVGEALDAEQLPGTKRVKEETLLGSFSAWPHFERLGGLAAEREREDGAALCNVDVVAEAFVRRAFFIELPGGGIETFAEEGVVFEDEEEGPLPEVGEGDWWRFFDGI